MITPPSRPPAPERPEIRGGGCLIAAGLLIGTIVGIAFREGSIGLVAGFAAGVVGAVLLFLIDRRR